MAKHAAAQAAQIMPPKGDVPGVPARKKRRTLQDLKVKEIDILEAPVAADYPETLLDLARVLFAELLNHDGKTLDMATAAEVARAQAEAMRAELGGQILYVSRGKAMESAARRKLIASEFNGRNMNALARKHGLSYEGVRRALIDEGAYTPARVKPESMEWRSRLVAEFTGDNFAALALKHGICETYVRQIIRQAQRRKRSGRAPRS